MVGYLQTLVGGMCIGIGTAMLIIGNPFGLAAIGSGAIGAGLGYFNQQRSGRASR